MVRSLWFRVCGLKFAIWSLRLGLELFSDGLIPASRPFVRLAPIRQVAFVPPCGRLACPPNGLPPPMRPAGLSAKRHSILTSFVRLCPFTIKPLSARAGVRLDGRSRSGRGTTSMYVRAGVRLAQRPCTPTAVRPTHAYPQLWARRSPLPSPASDARTPCPRTLSDAYAPAADARADAQREQVRRLANCPSS